VGFLIRFLILISFENSAFHKSMQDLSHAYSRYCGDLLLVRLGKLTDVVGVADTFTLPAPVAEYQLLSTLVWIKFYTRIDRFGCVRLAC